MKRAFTLLELVVVIIIIGILATLGIQQYARMIEKSRGAEAKQVLGQIRGSAAAYRLENNNSCVGFTGPRAGIGIGVDQIPSACVARHYFSYAVNVAGVAADTIRATATRCVGANGKQPGASTAFTLILNTDFALGTDVWTGTGGY